VAHLTASNIVFIVGFGIYATIRGVFERGAKGRSGVRGIHGTELILIAVLFLGTVLLPALYLFTPLLSAADYRSPAWALPTGAALMAAALWLFWRSHVDLGPNWSVTLEVREGQQLVTHGVYSRIRHPMYAAIWLFSAAQALLLANWVAGYAALLTFALMYFVRIPREERMMLDSFGQRYSAYMAQTGRLLPRLSFR